MAKNWISYTGKNNQLFPVVGIGASAGGSEAFTQLLRHLQSDTGMAFVLIQYLAPDQKSLLTEVLAKVTQMPVVEVKDGMSVEPDHDDITICSSI